MSHRIVHVFRLMHIKKKKTMIVFLSFYLRECSFFKNKALYNFEIHVLTLKLEVK